MVGVGGLCEKLLITVRVRREALLIRVEVRDLPPLTLSQQGGEAGGSLIREAPGRAGAALTKPGCASTARWRGSGERDGEEYARNQRLRLLKAYRLQPGGYGPGAARTRSLHCGAGNSGAGLWMSAGEATVKGCGVAVAMPQGQSWAPTSTSESQ